jgi:hypothetical protein
MEVFPFKKKKRKYNIDPANEVDLNENEKVKKNS